MAINPFLLNLHEQIEEIGFLVILINFFIKLTIYLIAYFVFTFIFYLIFQVYGYNYLDFLRIISLLPGFLLLIVFIPSGLIYIPSNLISKYFNRPKVLS